jgi:hypothetical protein
MRFLKRADRHGLALLDGRTTRFFHLSLRSHFEKKNKLNSGADVTLSDCYGTDTTSIRPLSGLRYYAGISLFLFVCNTTIITHEHATFQHAISVVFQLQYDSSKVPWKKSCSCR